MRPCPGQGADLEAERLFDYSSLAPPFSASPLVVLSCQDRYLAGGGSPQVRRAVCNAHLVHASRPAWVAPPLGAAGKRTHRCAHACARSPCPRPVCSCTAPRRRSSVRPMGTTRSWPSCRRASGGARGAAARRSAPRPARSSLLQACYAGGRSAQRTRAACLHAP